MVASPVRQLSDGRLHDPVETVEWLEIMFVNTPEGQARPSVQGSHRLLISPTVPYPPATTRWYAVFVLLIMFMLSFTDRQIISLMVTPIQADLGLSDVQIGLLQGVGFSLLYVVSGLFIGWAIDRYSRRMLILIGVIIWSLSCGLCGLSAGFWSLFFARAGVGVGEATLGPGAPSMLSDLFPRDRLSSALGVFTVGANLGIALSFSLGGIIVGMLSRGDPLSIPVVGALAPWQVVFLVVGLPGVPLAFLILTVPEPVRRGQFSKQTKFLTSVLRFLATQPRLFACHFIGFSLNALIGYGLLAWAPALLGRRFGWDATMIGPALGLVVGAFGIMGSLSAGFIADHFFRKGVNDIQLRLHAMTMAAAAPVAMLALNASSPWLVLAGIGVIYFGAAAAVPLSTAALQLVVPNEFRGQVTSVYAFISTLVGLSLGPLLVALVTEHVLGDRNSVGLAMAIVVSIAAAISCLLMLLGRHKYGSAVQAMNNAEMLGH